MDVHSNRSGVERQRTSESLRQKMVRLHREGQLGLAVGGQIGGWVSAIGERVGSQQLIFNRLTYWSFHRGALETAPAAVAGLLHIYPRLRRAVDLGCGTGVYLNLLRSRGLNVIGYEHSPRARADARKRYNLQVRSFDLNDFAGVDQPCDLCLCIEVAHYLSPALGDALVRHCAAAAPLVMFSSAQPGQHGFGHTNGQPPQYWIDRFKQQGFTLSQPQTDQLRQYIRGHIQRGFWLADNVCLLQRGVNA